MNYSLLYSFPTYRVESLLANYDKLWCYYKEDEELLETGNTPADFVENDDLFVENILEEKIPALEKLGFTKEEAKDIYEAYQDL